MNIRIVLLILLLIFSACRTNSGGSEIEKQDYEMAFDKVKWKVKDGADYPHRDKMLNDLVSNDTVRSLSKSEIMDLLGEPDRTNENYLYYMVKQRRIRSWPLHTKTMVVKLSEHETIEWIKVHD